MDFLRGILFSALSTWAPPLSLCFSHSEVRLMATNFQPLSPTGWKWVLGEGEGMLLAQKPHNLISQLVKTLLVMETLASLDQMVQLGSVSSHRAPTACPAPVRASTACWAQHKLLLCARPEGKLLLCVKSSTGSYCVSGPSYMLGPAQAPTVCRAQHKLPLCAGPSTSSHCV